VEERDMKREKRATFEAPGYNTQKERIPPTYSLQLTLKQLHAYFCTASPCNIK
jgi:hypothetical protein